VQIQGPRIDCERAEALLLPIANFLFAGGLSKRAAQQIFSSAFEKAKSAGGARRVDRIGHPTQYADVVALWAYDSRFVDLTGRPRQLSFRGKNEFTALIKAANPQSNARAVLAVLMRYGNVRRTKEAKYELIRPFFFASTRESVAFEPMAYFLSDAGHTLGRILKRTRRLRGPELFWRKVESTRLTEAAAVRFTEFIRDRSLAFLEELDDWLEAQAERRRGRGKQRKFRRVGLGLFSIHSDLEESSANR